MNRSNEQAAADPTRPPINTDLRIIQSHYRNALGELERFHLRNAFGGPVSFTADEVAACPICQAIAYLRHYLRYGCWPVDLHPALVARDSALAAEAEQSNREAL